MNYQDFLYYNSNINSNVNDENKKLIDELNRCRKENDELKNQINLLNNELAEAKKIISNIKNNNQQNNNIDINHAINNLNEIIKMKDNLINDLKNQLKNKGNKNVDFNDIMVVNFISLDQRINCGIKCLKTDTFAEVEEKLYQKYEEYREINNNFTVNGNIVLRFKTINDNHIKDGDKIQLIDI